VATMARCICARRFGALARGSNVGPARGPHANRGAILLVIDQGEELFAGSDAKQTDEFFRALNALLDEEVPFLALMSLRSDFLGGLQQEPRLRAAFEDFLLKQMPLERVREIIEGPSKVAGVAVEVGLVGAAMSDARMEDALPLLAFTASGAV
jgi:hypothetical protein